MQVSDPAAGIENAQDDVIQGTRASSGACRFSFKHAMNVADAPHEVRVTAIDKSTCQAKVITGVPTAPPSVDLSSPNSTTHHHHRDITAPAQGTAPAEGTLATAAGAGPLRLSYGLGGGSRGPRAQSNDWAATEYVIWEDPPHITVNEMFVSVRAYYDGSSVYALDCDDYEHYADTGWYIDWNYAQYDCNADSTDALYDVSMHFENDSFCASTTTNTYYLDEAAYAEPSSGTLSGYIDYTWSDGDCAWLLDEYDYPVQHQFEMAPAQTAFMPARRGAG